jgi:hypothetical protein
MIRSPTAKSDLSPHAAAIERLDNEGGVSSQASKQKEVDKVRMHRRSISANRDEQEDRLPDFGLGMNAGQQQHRDKNECSRR